jgi:hypothetical protein
MPCISQDKSTVHNFNCSPKTQDVWPVNLNEMCLMQLLDDLKEKRGYWKLKEEVLDRFQW